MKKFTSFCQVLKEMHTKENRFFFSASRCICGHCQLTTVTIAGHAEVNHQGHLKPRAVFHVFPTKTPGSRPA